jgi:amino acid transporter
MSETKQDRELIELLTELRVALPGVQVLFAFLLVVPFSQGFSDVTSTQKAVYFAAFVCTALATAFLIAPTSYHRLRWRARDKERMLITSNRMTIAGTVFLALAIACVVFFITDFLYPDLTAWVTAAIVGALAWLWFGIPLLRAAKRGSNDPA